MFWIFTALYPISDIVQTSHLVKIWWLWIEINHSILKFDIAISQREMDVLTEKFLRIHKSDLKSPAWLNERRKCFITAYVTDVNLPITWSELGHQSRCCNLTQLNLKQSESTLLFACLHVSLGLWFEEKIFYYYFCSIFRWILTCVSEIVILFNSPIFSSTWSFIMHRMQVNKYRVRLFP